MHSNPYFFNVYLHTSAQYSSQDSHPIIPDNSQRRFLYLAPVVKPSLLYPALP